MHCRILFLINAILLVWTGFAFALTVSVRVDGVEGDMRENVMARLELYLHRDSPRLNVYEVRRLHNKAEADIRSALAPFGYFSPEIESALSQEGDDFTATYSIEIGEPVLVRNLYLEAVGEGADALRPVMNQFPLKAKGLIVHQGDYEDGKKRIIREALRRGFMRATFIEHELRINKRERWADIHLVLDTGPQFVFGETTFEQEALDSPLLTRFLTYTEGEPYKPQKLIELQRAFYDTEYFDRVVVDGQVNAAVDHAVPVSVLLTTPEYLNRYSVGLGYATDTGARARLEWKNRLLNSKGHKVRTSMQVSERDNNFLVNYSVPWRNPLVNKMVYNAGYHDQEWDDTDTRLLTAGVRLEHRGRLIRHTGSFELRDEEYDVGATSGDSFLVVPSYTGTLHWADNLRDTRYGLELSLSVSGASEVLGSDATFLKGVVGGKVIIPFLPGWRLIGRGNLGATLVDSIDDLPPSLRFYTGGDNSIRGYGYKELGTKDSSGTVVGGRYLVVGSAEVEKELNETWSAAAFWDVGNAIDDLSLRFKQGVGVGIRYRLPFGQVRFDVASAILEDGAPVRLHLTVGADL